MGKKLGVIGSILFTAGVLGLQVSWVTALALDGMSGVALSAAISGFMLADGIIVWYAAAYPGWSS